MRTALVLMTILGCDDSVTQCHHVASPPARWETVAQCDAEMEKSLRRYTNIHYPSVIALCQPVQVAAPDRPATPAEPAATAAPLPQTTQAAKPSGFVGRTMAQVRDLLPSAHGVKSALFKPVHFVSTSYAWVARRLTS